jgi:hypothetical protein
VEKYKWPINVALQAVAIAITARLVKDVIAAAVVALSIKKVKSAIARLLHLV